MSFLRTPSITPALGEQVNRKIFQLQLVKIKDLQKQLQFCNAEQGAKVWRKLGAISGEFIQY